MPRPDTNWQDLLESVRAVDTAVESAQLLDAMLARLSPTTLAFVNAHTMNTVRSDPEFVRALRRTSCLLRDGSGMATLMRLVGRRPGINMNGTDLIPRILARHGGRRVALFGTREPYLGVATDRIIEEAGIARDHVLTADGFQDEAFYIRKMQAFEPGIIVLGMGAPKQERLAVQLALHSKTPCLIVSGGAILDFYARRFGRAPAWMRGLGMEWCYRLAREPRRLFRRYVIGNPVFLARSFRLAWRTHTGNPVPARHAPLTEIRLATPDERLHEGSSRGARKG